MSRQYKVSLEDFAKIYNESNTIPEVQHKVHAQFDENISRATVYRLKDRCRAFRMKLKRFTKFNKTVAALIEIIAEEKKFGDAGAELQDLGFAPPEEVNGSYEHANEGE